MALLTLNLPGCTKGIPLMTPGIKGALLNGFIWDVGNQIPEDTVVGIPLPKSTKARDPKELLSDVKADEPIDTVSVTIVAENKEENK